MGKKLTIWMFLFFFFNINTVWAKNEISYKTFIPGMVQLSHNEEVKGLIIIGCETISLLTGSICWYISESEYNKYKKLPANTPQEEFDKHLNASEFYGTLAIGSFVIFGATYIYSVIDAIWFSKSKEKKQSFYFIPKKRGISLCIIF